MSTFANVVPEIQLSAAQSNALERLFEGKPLGEQEWAALVPVTDALGLHRAKEGFWGALGEITGFADFRRMFKVSGVNNKISGGLSGSLKVGAIGYGGYVGGKYLYNKLTK